MKLDEDLGPDREVEFQTDDEENEAERVCENESDSGSENTGPSLYMSNSSVEANNPKWPQSYRRSIDVLTGLTPPSTGFLRGACSSGMTKALNSVYMTQNSGSETHPSLSEPLVSTECFDKEDAPISTVPELLLPSSRSNSSSINELPTRGGNSSVAQATFNGINVLCGVGLLTTPYAVKEGGWVGLLILFLLGTVCCYTALLLKKCLESSPGLQTYPDIGQAAFGVLGRLAISATCVEYTIMMGDNLSRLFPSTCLDFAGITLDSQQIFSILSTLIVLPTVWLRDLTLLSYLSVGGVGASILVALCLVWVGAVDKVGFHPSGTPLELAGLPVAIGIYGFGFSGHSVIPNIWSSMKETSRLPIVLIVSFVFCWVMYTGVAICGFLMFGESIESQYTLNMPEEFVASKVALWTTVINPMTKYALNMMPVALCLEELMPLGRRRSYTASLVIRTILVASTLVVALKVPFFGFVMALIGSLLAMLVAVIFPCACYLRILHARLTTFQIATCIFTISVGVVCGLIGTYSAVSRIAGQIG